MYSFSSSIDVPGWLLHQVISEAGCTPDQSMSACAAPPASEMVGPPQAARAAEPPSRAPRRRSPRRDSSGGVMSCLPGGRVSSGDGAGDQPGDDPALEEEEDGEDGDGHQDGAGHDHAPVRDAVE